MVLEQSHSIAQFVKICATFVWLLSDDIRSPSLVLLPDFIGLIVYNPTQGTFQGNDSQNMDQ